MTLLELQKRQVVMFSTITVRFWLGAMKEGDGMRLVRQYKYFMLYCNADDPHGTKYSLECLYQFFLCHLGTLNVLLGTGSKIIMVTKALPFLSMRQQSAATIM